MSASVWAELVVGSTSTYKSQSAVTSCSFDAHKELLWAGTHDGRLSSHYSLNLEKRSSVVAHPSAVLSVHSYATGVLSLSASSLRFHARGGLLRSSLTTPPVGAFQCSLVPDATQAIVLLAAAGADADAASAAAAVSSSSSASGFSSLYPPQASHASLFPASVSAAHLPKAAIGSTVASSSPPTLSRPSLVLFDISQNASVRQLQVDCPVSTLCTHPFSFFACGRRDGQVELRDARSMRSEHTLSAHTGPVASMSLSSSLLVTCGTSAASVASSSAFAASASRVDQFVKVFDIRRLHPLTPLVFRTGGGAGFLSFLPATTAASPSTFALLNRMGLLYFADAETALLQPVCYDTSVMATGATVSGFDVSSSGELMAVADTAGLLHELGVVKPVADDGTVDAPVVNALSSPLDYVGPPAPPAIELSLSSSVAELPFPFLCSCSYTPLVSDMSGYTLLTCMKPLPPADDRLVAGIRYIDHVGYAQTAGQHSDELSLPVSALPPNSLTLFRHFAGKGRPTASSSRPLLPPPLHPEYRRVTLSLPKYGLASLDLSAYNSTRFTALDSLLPNSYCNCLLLLLYFLPRTHARFLSHLCLRENCLRCELGFLFHMLDEARGSVAQPRNLLRALRLIPEASGLGLLDEMDWKGGDATNDGQADERRYVLSEHWVREEVKDEEGQGKLGARVQDCFRFVLEMLSKEEVREGQSRERHRGEERERRWQLRHRQHGKRHGVLSWQLSSLQQQLMRQGGRATREQEDSMHALAAEMQQLMHEAQLDDSAEAERQPGSVQDDADDSAAVMERVFGHRVLLERTCAYGGHTLRREQTLLYARFTYSTTVYTASSPLPMTQPLPRDTPFTAYMQRALTEETAGRVWCEQCGAYQVMHSRRLVQTLPEVLNVESNASSEKEERVWKQGRGGVCSEEEQQEGDVHWLPLYLAVTIVEQGMVQVTRLSRRQALEALSGIGLGGEAAAAWTSGRHRVYELTCSISHILDPPDTHSALHSNNGEHLVTHCNISRQYRKEKLNEHKQQPHSSQEPAATDRPEGQPQQDGDDGQQQQDRRWFVFNEFVIRPSSGYEASCFSYPWKSPCIVVYSAMSPLSSPPAPPVVNPFLAGVVPFSYGPSLSLRSDLHRPTFSPLNSWERLGPHFRVAIDCEFVCVQPELLSSSSPPAILRPARLTLARVSCVRGTANSPLLGVPFMDDYISTSEHVVDYLTAFSGLVPGDLSPSTSPHYLTTLKQSYIRLRHLVDAGCVFVGHGLVNDFVMLNLWVREEQVVDSVELWRLKGGRRLGLRFLAKHLLGLDVQREVHDSVEDARTALALVTKYDECRRKGEVDRTLQRLYQIGHQTGFKL